MFVEHPNLLDWNGRHLPSSSVIRHLSLRSVLLLLMVGSREKSG